MRTNNDARTESMTQSWQAMRMTMRMKQWEWEWQAMSVEWRSQLNTGKDNANFIFSERMPHTMDSTHGFWSHGSWWFHGSWMNHMMMIHDPWSHHGFMMASWKIATCARVHIFLSRAFMSTCKIRFQDWIRCGDAHLLGPDRKGIKQIEFLCWTSGFDQVFSCCASSPWIPDGVAFTY